MSERKMGEAYTCEDYYSWNDGERWELIGGLPRAMSPAPSYRHQRAAMELGRQLANFLKGKTCKVLSAPFDVRLNADEGNDTVVQPDISVVCDPDKLDERGCKGAPDLVVEVISPSTAGHDRLVKFNLYLQAGVREYWIVDPVEKSVQTCILQGGVYVVHMYAETDSASVRVLPGCTIDLQDVFEE
jgi:Uma2 family endonuclease